MRRLAPRPLSVALEAALPAVEPATPLAAAQAVWADVAGPGLAAFAAPVSERQGVLTVACDSGSWAHELELLGPDLLDTLNAAMREKQAPSGTFSRLRFVVGSAPN